MHIIPSFGIKQIQIDGAMKGIIMKNMKKIDKILIIISALIIVASIIIRAITGANDVGILVMLSFAAIMVWVIFLVCSFFPADWRMTKKQKDKIKDMGKYQANYQTILILIDTLAAISFALIIILIA